MSHPFGLTREERFWSRCAFYAATTLALWLVDVSGSRGSREESGEVAGLAKAYHGYPGLPPEVALARARNSP